MNRKKSLPPDLQKIIDGLPTKEEVLKDPNGGIYYDPETDTVMEVFTKKRLDDYDRLFGVKEDGSPVDPEYLDKITRDIKSFRKEQSNQDQRDPGED